MAAQDDLQSKNDLDHVTRSVELPLIASSPTEFLQRCGRLYPDRRTDGRVLLYWTTGKTRQPGLSVHVVFYTEHFLELSPLFKFF